MQPLPVDNRISLRRRGPESLEELLTTNSDGRFRPVFVVQCSTFDKTAEISKNRVRRKGERQYRLMNNGGPQSRTSLTLMQQLRANPRDSDAWSTFLHTYGPRIDAWCRRWKLQEADVQDVTQNVLLKLAKQFERFEYNPDSSFRSWLRTVTEHALSDFVATHKQTNTVTSVPNVLFSQEARQEFPHLPNI